MKPGVKIESLLWPQSGCMILLCDPSGIDELYNHLWTQTDVIDFWAEQTEDEQGDASGTATFYVVLPLGSRYRKAYEVYKALVRALTTSCDCDGCREMQKQIESNSLPVPRRLLAAYRPKNQKRLLARARGMFLMAQSGGLN